MTDISWPFATSGGGGSPGGSSPQLQFNNAGAFGGTTGLEYDSANLALRGLTGLTGGVRLYNTADITTNTEFLRTYWGANVAYLITDTQGSGTTRELRLGTYNNGSNQNLIRVFSSSGTPFMTFQTAASSNTAFTGYSFAHGALSAASGSQTIMSITGTVNQSGTAGFNGLWINPTITTTGSGGNWLLKVENSSSFRAGIAVNGQLRLSSGSGQVDFMPSGNSLIISPGASSSALTAVQILNGTMATNSLGTYVGLSVAGAMNQSGTAGYTALDINVTETATGSGTKKLIDTRVGGTTLFSILNTGRIQYVSGNTGTTVGAAGGASAPPATPTGYLLIDIGGTTFKVPYYAN